MQHLGLYRCADDALVADVVHGEHAARGLEQPVPGIGRAQQQRSGRGVPVVEMHDLRRKRQALATQEGGVRQHQEAQVLVGVRGVERGAAVDRGAFDQVDRRARIGQLRA